MGRITETSRLERHPKLSSRSWSRAEDNVLALDVDGVLVHSSEELGGGKWDSRLALDLGIDPESLREKFFAKYWSEIIVGQRDLKEDLAIVLPELHPQVNAEELVAYWFAHDACVDQSVAELVQEWRRETGGRSVAVTNQEKYRVAYLGDNVGLGNLVDCVLWSGEMGVTKSNPDFYAAAIKRMDVEPDRVWFFDDDIRNVEVAASAGWNAHLFVNVELMRVTLSASVT